MPEPRRFPIPRLVSIAVALLALMLSGCGLTPRAYSQLPGLQHNEACRSLLAEMQQRVRDAGASQALGQPLRDFPYLRSDRFLASFRQQLDSPAQRQHWQRRLYALGARARSLELDNLAPPFSLAERDRIESCISMLAAQDRRNPDYFATLQRQSRVADAYHDGLRLLGLFPLTRLPVLQAIEAEQATWKRLFNDPILQQQPSRLYRPAPFPSTSPPLDAGQISDWLSQARQGNPLGIPELPTDRLWRLFAHFAPVWKIYQHSDDDRIGRPYWSSAGSRQASLPAVDIEDPVSYLQPGYTRFGGQSLLQLNYMVWFPARSRQQRYDIYAGRLDGLIWRVTLAADGGVLSYDSIHACGCYHKLYPQPGRARLRDLADGAEQPMIITDGVPPAGAGPLVIHVQPQNHYIIGLSADRGTAGSRYRTEGYQRLLQLPLQRPLQAPLQAGADAGRRSLFGAEGRVAASARLERWLLWPMGVESAGAMRQWGHHAISFTDNRHFDDPFLLELFFEPD